MVIGSPPPELGPSPGASLPEKSLEALARGLPFYFMLLKPFRDTRELRLVFLW